eukprot:6717787-Alexandrium_andersonii.AAC.1
MSASLVGSEMCIRDRGGKEGWVSSRTPRPRSSPTRSRGTCRSPVSFGGCLLYTSDAADDM